MVNTGSWMDRRPGSQTQNMLASSLSWQTLILPRWRREEGKEGRGRDGGRKRGGEREVRGRKTLQLLIIETIYFTPAPQGHHSIYCGKGHSGVHGGCEGGQAGDTGLLHLSPLPGEREGIHVASSWSCPHLHPVLHFLQYSNRRHGGRKGRGMSLVK